MNRHTSRRIPIIRALPVLLWGSLVIGTGRTAVADDPFDVAEGETQTVAAEARLDELERELAALRAELGLPSAADAGSGDARSAIEPAGMVLLQRSQPTATPPPPPASPKYPTINVTGLIQADAAWFREDGRFEAAVGDVEDFAGFRRARLGVKGQAGEHIGYMMEFDFGFPGRPNFTNVYVEMQDLPAIGTFRAGQWKHPVHLEAVSSIRELVFMERSLPFGAFVPFRQIGAGLFNTACDELVTWAVSGYRYPSSPFGNVFGDDGYGMAARVTGLPYSDDRVNGNVHVGLGFSHNSPSTGRLRFRTNPEVGMTDGDFHTSPIPLPFFVDTGNIPASAYDLIDLELAASVSSLLFEAEWLGTTVNQQAGPGLAFHGGYAQLAWVLTGESRKYNRKVGVFGRVIPDRPWGTGGCGAWELAARCSYIDLNDRNVQGGRQHDWTIGLNWYLNGFTRFQFNYIHVLLDSPVNGDSSADITAVRAQMDF